MTTLDPSGNYLILINTFEVSPQNADRLVDVLHEASGPIGKRLCFGQSTRVRRPEARGELRPVAHPRGLRLARYRDVLR